MTIQLKQLKHITVNDDDTAKVCKAHNFVNDDDTAKVAKAHNCK